MYANAIINWACLLCTAYLQNYVKCNNKICFFLSFHEAKQKIKKTTQNSQCELIVCLWSRLITLFIFHCVAFQAMHRPFGRNIRSPLTQLYHRDSQSIQAREPRKEWFFSEFFSVFYHLLLRDPIEYSINVYAAYNWTTKPYFTNQNWFYTQWFIVF